MNNAISKAKSTKRDETRKVLEAPVTCTGPLVVAFPLVEIDEEVAPPAALLVALWLCTTGELVAFALVELVEEVAPPAALLVALWLCTIGELVGVDALLPGEGLDELIGATEVSVFALCCVWLVTPTTTVLCGGLVLVATTTLLVTCA